MTVPIYVPIYVFRILLGLEPPTRGQTFLLDAALTELSAKLHGRIGYVAEGHNLIQNYRVGRLIKLCKDLSLQWNDEFFNHLTLKRTNCSPPFF